jgi:multiple sugar transport system permease protein
MLLPFLWMLTMSFKNYREATAIPIIWFPAKFSFDNYIQVLNSFNFGRYIINTIFVTILTTVVQLFFCSITAYGFSKFRFPGRDIMFFLFLCLLMVPGQMVLLPRYFMIIRFQWIDTYRGLIVPHYVSIYGTFLLRQYFMSLPQDLVDSAKIDGCSYIRIYGNILLPLMTNALIALTIYTVVYNWNDLLWPLMVIDSDKMRTLAVGIASLRDKEFDERHLQMTAGVLAMAPLIFSFLVGQKYFIKSIALSGIKG